MHQEHSILREGLLTGLVGGLIVAVWFLVYDLGRGQLGYTPNVLGQVFIARDTMPAVRTVMPRAVIDYSILHFATFCVLGIGLTWLTHLASRNPSLRMGVWLGLVIAFGCFLGFLVMLHTATDQRFPWVSSVVGSSLGIGSMGWFLWRRHPHLRSTFRQVPLGSETEPPPHPAVKPRR
ncbi:MAG: hypothetical protein ACJ8BF_05925 [Gemmatimonadales bacterium]